MVYKVRYEVGAKMAAKGNSAGTAARHRLPGGLVRTV
jgi:hypothetical protein